MPGWDSIPEAERPFQLRLMEVFAGFVEHVDVQAGKVIDELERQGIRDNTLVIYIFGDNGSSAEGQQGSISELLAQNQIPNTIAQQLAALERLGGLDALGGPKVDNMYHAGWAWAGDTPFQHTKLIASHFGGTRNPMAISWPKGIRPTRRRGPSFTTSTTSCRPSTRSCASSLPRWWTASRRTPSTGRVWPIPSRGRGARPQADPILRQQRQPRSLPGRLVRRHLRPADALAQREPGLADLGPEPRMSGSSTTSTSTSRRPTTLPRRSRSGWRVAMKALFVEEAKANEAFPIGAGIWLRIHPEDRIKTPYRSWQFDATTTRMPEFTAPGLGRESNQVTIDAEFGENASGVLYALGGASGG
jgi:hypothetical protein